MFYHAHIHVFLYMVSMTAFYMRLHALCVVLFVHTLCTYSLYISVCVVLSFVIFMLFPVVALAFGFFGFFGFRELWAVEGISCLFPQT